MSTPLGSAAPTETRRRPVESLKLHLSPARNDAGARLKTVTEALGRRSVDWPLTCNTRATVRTRSDCSCKVITAHPKGCSGIVEADNGRTVTQRLPFGDSPSFSDLDDVPPRPRLRLEEGKRVAPAREPPGHRSTSTFGVVNDWSKAGTVDTHPARLGKITMNKGANSARLFPRSPRWRSTRRGCVERVAAPPAS